MLEMSLACHPGSCMSFLESSVAAGGPSADVPVTALYGCM